MADIIMYDENAIEPTGDAVANALDTAPPAPRYDGASTVAIPEEQAAKLMAPVDPDMVLIRPDGLIYVPEIEYRRRLNAAFGPGGWAILPISIWIDSASNMIYYRGQLWAGGRFVAEAIGEQAYFANNPQMSYATAAESAKSNMLVRTCKDIGLFSELWDPTWSRRWVSEFATEAWCVNIGSRDRGKKKKMWRKKSAPLIDMYPWKEEGPGGDEPPRMRVDAPQHGTAPSGGPAPERPARATDRSEAAGSAPDDFAPRASSASSPLCSVKQIGRFRAIARSNGWTEDEQAKLLEKFGFDRAEAITRDAYDRICSALENPVILTEVRAEIDEALDYGIE